jgi:hypothetical protein
VIHRPLFTCETMIHSERPNQSITVSFKVCSSLLHNGTFHSDLPSFVAITCNLAADFFDWVWLCVVVRLHLVNAIASLCVARNHITKLNVDSCR